MERESYLDIAKGIGIIMVVWAHASGPFTSFIESFHMPLFFFISGMLYHGNKSITEYIKRKMIKLLVPFWTCNLLLYPLFFLLYYWNRWSFRIALREVFGILITVGKVPFLGATWFLAALFWVSASVHILCKILEKHKVCDLCILLIGIITAIIGLNITLPYRLSRNMICCFYYIVGYLYRKNVRLLFSLKEKSIIAPIFFVVGLYLSYLYPSSLGDNVYSNKFSFLIAALFSTLFVLLISYLLSKIELNSIVKSMISLGNNSKHILIWHFLAFRIAICIQILFCDTDLSALTAFPVFDSGGWWFILYLLSGIIGSILIGKVINRFILTFFGKVYSRYM